MIHMIHMMPLKVSSCYWKILASKNALSFSISNTYQCCIRPLHFASSSIFLFPRFWSHAISSMAFGERLNAMLLAHNPHRAVPSIDSCLAKQNWVGERCGFASWYSRPGQSWVTTQGSWQRFFSLLRRCFPLLTSSLGTNVIDHKCLV